MTLIRAARHQCWTPSAGVWAVYQCDDCGRIWELWPDGQWRRVRIRALWWRLTDQAP